MIAFAPQRTRRHQPITISVSLVKVDAAAERRFDGALERLLQLGLRRRERLAAEQQTERAQ